MPPIPERGGGVSRDALLVIHIPLLHFSYYFHIPQYNVTSGNSLYSIFPNATLLPLFLEIALLPYSPTQRYPQVTLSLLFDS